MTPLQVLSAPTSSGLNLQGSYNPQSVGTLGMNTSATSPTTSTPKTLYTQQVASQMTPTATFYKPDASSQQVYNAQGQAVSHDQYIAQGGAANYSNVQSGYWPGYQTPQVSSQSQPTQPAQLPTAPTGFNGYSGGMGSTQGVYDPYNSPAYQDYLNKYISSQTPGLSTDQINSGTISTEQTLANIAKTVANQTANAQNNPAMSDQALTGQTMAAARQGALESSAVQPLLDLYKQQQTQAGVATGAGLSAANAHAGYLAGLATPTPISTGQQLTQLNPATGKVTNLANQPSFGLGTGIAGQPITYNQNTGQIGSQGLGTTPPSLGTNTSGTSGIVNSTLQSLGVGNDPTASAFYTNAVNQALANGGNVDPSLTAQQQSVVKQILSQMSGGQYSSQTSAIQTGLTTTQQQQKAAYQSSYQQGQALQTQLISKIQSAGINPNDINALNSFTQGLAKNTSSSDYKEFENLLTDVISTYASILTPGTTTDMARSKADSLLDSSASGKSIIDTINTLDQQAQAKINGTITPPLNNGLQMPSGSGANSTYNPATGQQQIPAGSLSL